MPFWRCYNHTDLQCNRNVQIDNLTFNSKIASLLKSITRFITSWKLYPIRAWVRLRNKAEITWLSQYLMKRRCCWVMSWNKKMKVNKMKVECLRDVRKWKTSLNDWLIDQRSLIDLEWWFKKNSKWRPSTYIFRCFSIVHDNLWTQPYSNFIYDSQQM